MNIIFILFFIFAAKGKKPSKTMLQISIDEFKWRYTRQFACTDEISCRTSLVITRYMMMTISDSVIFALSGPKSEYKFNTTQFKEFVFDTKTILRDYYNVEYVYSDRTLSTIDVLINSYYYALYDLVCNPCLGVMLSEMLTYGKLKSFTITLKNPIKFYALYLTQINIAPGCRIGQKQCLIIITNGLGSCLEQNKDSTIALILAEKIAPKNTTLKMNYRIVDRYQQVFSIFRYDNVDMDMLNLGLGLYKDESDIGCYDDIYYSKNKELKSYELSVSTTSNGENGQFSGITSFTVGGYKYGGINLRHECSIQNNYTKCEENSIPICADARKRGNTCQEDSLICTQNNCKHNSKCIKNIHTQYCKCVDGSYGINCENWYCEQPCHNRLCDGPNHCGPCFPGFEGLNCSRKTCDNYKGCGPGVCSLSGGERICTCPSKTNDGEFCQHTCAPACVNGICKLINGNTFCVCDRGFIGPQCDRTTIARIFKNSNDFVLSLAIFVVVVFLIIMLITILVIFVNFTPLSKLQKFSEPAATIAHATLNMNAMVNNAMMQAGTDASKLINNEKVNILENNEKSKNTTDYNNIDDFYSNPYAKGKKNNQVYGENNEYHYSKPMYAEDTSKSDYAYNNSDYAEGYFKITG